MENSKPEKVIGYKELNKMVNEVVGEVYRKNKEGKLKEYEITTDPSPEPPPADPEPETVLKIKEWLSKKKSYAYYSGEDKVNKKAVKYYGLSSGK